MAIKRSYSRKTQKDIKMSAVTDKFKQALMEITSNDVRKAADSIRHNKAVDAHNELRRHMLHLIGNYNQHRYDAHDAYMRGNDKQHQMHNEKAQKAHDEYHKFFGHLHDEEDHKIMKQSGDYLGFYDTSDEKSYVNSRLPPIKKKKI